MTVSVNGSGGTIGNPVRPVKKKTGRLLKKKMALQKTAFPIK
jgi:hypothetical protein